MIAKVTQRVSKNKYTVVSVRDNSKQTVFSSYIGTLHIGDYVVVSDACIVAKTSYQSVGETYRV